jgi:hypothetical protein
MLPQVVPSIYGEAATAKLPEIQISEKDKIVLRELAENIANLAVLPIQQQRKEMWSDLNELKETKPMIWIDEVCWNEIDLNGELRLRTKGRFCRSIEKQLRRILYQWNHFQCDSVVEQVLYSPPCIDDTRMGIEIKERVIGTQKGSEVASHQYKRQINDEEDIEKIEFPEITFDEVASEEYYQAYRYLFDGVIEVKKGGVPGFWFAPWDDIVRFLGAQETLLSLVTEPRFMHKLISRFVDIYLHCLDQYERLGLLALNNTNVRIGSGGYGYSGELPQNEFNPHQLRTVDLWGCAAAQIFSAVSPAMHEEFSLQYERRWLERFGLSYYGCCEPLHEKISLLESVANLRKVSISPWADIESAAESISSKYVLSLKPNPSLLAKDQFTAEEVRHELADKLLAAKRNQCRVEIILKDISTVRHEPVRLTEWAKTATELCQRIYGE